MSGPQYDKSNDELRAGLRSNISDAQEDAAMALSEGADSKEHVPPYLSWIGEADHGKVLYVPRLDFTDSGLKEERDQYDITVKIFFLPDEDKSAREAHVREALGLVLKTLHMPSVNLLVVQFPGVYFDEGLENCPDKIKSRGPKQAEPEPLQDQLEAWKIVEKLCDEGLVSRLGLSEFGAERLASFVENVRIQPAVNQISLRDCCSVPKDLSLLAKTKSIELLVHNDSVDILPRGTLRSLLDQDGADILGKPLSDLKSPHKRKRSEDLALAERLEGDIEPQWVVKYTAVIKDRGVIEEKGYFACAKYMERLE